MIDRDRGVFMDVLSATSQFVTLCFEREKTKYSSFSF